MNINVGHTHFWILTQACDFPSWLIKSQIPKSSFHFEYLKLTSGFNSLAIESIEYQHMYTRSTNTTNQCHREFATFPQQ
jgi:hypothetical protein